MFILTFLTLNALAEDKSASDSRHGISLGVGTLGYSLSYIYAPTNDCALSVRYHMFPAPESIKEAASTGSDIGNYKDMTNLAGASLLVHYHPFKDFMKWARFSAGAVYNMSTIDISTSGNSSDDAALDLSENPLEATVSFNNVLPYLAFGTGIDNDKGVGFFLDLGTMYQGSANVSFSENTAVSEEGIQTEKSVLEDFYTSQVQFYPVLQLGATYMF